MDTDEIAPPPRAGDPLVLAIKVDLDPFSVAELHARIAVLENEVARTKARLDRTIGDRSAADALFNR